MQRFSSYFMDRFVAPGLSSFTHAEITDMSEVGPREMSWLRDYILNAALRGRPTDDRSHAMTFSFLRRVCGAFEHHHQARESTLSYLAALVPGEIHAVGYFTALFWWETFVGSAWQAFECLRGLSSIETGNKINFHEGDARQFALPLHRLSVTARHLHDRIEQGMLESASTTPIWLTNDGIRDKQHVLTYTSTKEILQGLALYADVLVDPRTAREKLNRS